MSETLDAVVLAGPNGCGKSCVLDAIRLLKSAYGSYVQDEWQMWLGEFQINANREAGELVGLLQDKTRPLRVAAQFVLSDGERHFIRSDAPLLVEEHYWRQTDPQRARGNAQLSLSERQRSDDQRLKDLLTVLVPRLLAEVEAPFHEAALEIGADGATRVKENRLLELVFSTYSPQQLGVIDYHGKRPAAAS